ncbi:protease IV [Salmonella enterica subsp. enterica]|nr:protease IV [Salmonella enterica subsp. enterica]
MAGVKPKNNYRAISYYDYSLKTPADTGGTIAVIFANGAIMDGEETPGNVGGDTTASQIRDARLDPKVKAIVLRVNSPGGSVNASEVIRAELAAAKAAGKPVVVSMGGMAASGGLLDLYAGKLYCGQPQHADGLNWHLRRHQYGRKQPVVDWRTQRRRFHLAAGGYFDDQSAVTGSAADDATQY